MLPHSILNWPEVADLKLWPFALAHAILLWNRERCQIIVITITNNNFRLRYVSSKLDQGLLLLLLTNKL
jgi:hypothetical protein